MSCERGDGPVVALDGDDARAPSANSARVSPPGPGPISSTVAPASGSGGARDARGEIEIEQKILAERFLRGETVAADDLAQRRQAVFGIIWAPVTMRRAKPGSSALASRAASLSAATRLVGSALPVPAMSKAVP